MNHSTGTAGRPRLKRVLGIWALTIYGVGDILGAGIYALVGKVAGLADHLTWLSFACALGVAALTAASYAELGSRFPKSSGEALYCEQALRRTAPALLIGWLVFCSGVVSMAAVSHAFAGYLRDLLPQTPHGGWILVFLVALCAINFWGIRLTSRANIVCTVVEAGGLLLIIVVGLAFIFGRSEPIEPTPRGATVGWFQVGQGAALAFFAFIGFEDMVKVSEEVRSPRRNLPLALFLALALAGLIYVLVATVATSVIPAQELARSEAPLTEVIRRAAPWFPPPAFSIIAIFAVSNTALLNCVMASRLIYGMSEQRLLPAWLGRVHAGRRTPHLAILVVLIAAVALAASGTLSHLAETTSVLLLLVFLSVHVALIIIKRRDNTPAKTFRVPAVLPLAGAVFCVVLIALVSRGTLLMAGALVGIGLIIVALRGWSVPRDAG